MLSDTRQILLHQDRKYVKIQKSRNFCYLKPVNKINHTFAKEIHGGLDREKKFIHPKFFYDQKGSQLFEEICELPEYYLTRKEIEILKSIKSSLPSYLTDKYSLVELGSGSAVKTRKIIEILTKHQKFVDYYPIDISEILEEGSNELLNHHSNLQITGIIDEYEHGLEIVSTICKTKKLIAFLGSSLGNFNMQQSKEFLKRIYNTMDKDDLFLTGLDLVKDKKILDRAYNDSKGITARFNLNLLSRINSELHGNFEQTKFEHVAFFNEDNGRIEMHLRSKERQTVHIPDINLILALDEGELIHTEYSYKYTLQQIHKMAEEAGFRPLQIWQDKDNFFALALLSPNV
ncbi:MAG: L-histidine N(alpha)-methyltransferase [Thaumarchaeota archaeon]|nr:L-histidine N(alpha)-methyltransferase [Nitrososphaerota archaeon]